MSLILARFIVHCFAFSDLTLLVGQQEEHCKNWVMGCWCGYLSVCIWSSWCHRHPQTPSSLASFKSRPVLSFWYQLTQVVLEKRPLNGHVVVVTVHCLSETNLIWSEMQIFTSQVITVDNEVKYETQETNFSHTDTGFWLTAHMALSCSFTDGHINTNFWIHCLSTVQVL